MKRYLGKRKLLKIYIDSSDKLGSKMLWEEILNKAKKLKIGGATVYKGVAGIGVHSKISAFSVWSLSQKLPLIIEIIETEDKIQEFIKVLDEILQEGLVTLSDTEVISYKHPKFSK
jgi:PII-like signaling protein